MRVRVSVTDDDGELFEGEVELTSRKTSGKSKGKTKVTVQKPKKKAASTMENRILELKEENFFKEPREAGEIKKELGLRGFHYNKDPIRMRLLIMVRNKDLKRVEEKMGKKKIYKYVNP
jgi:hypothetical protein